MNTGKRIWLVSCLTIALGAFNLATGADLTDAERIRAADRAVLEKLRQRPGSM